MHRGRRQTAQESAEQEYRLRTPREALIWGLVPATAMGAVGAATGALGWSPFGGPVATGLSGFGFGAALAIAERVRGAAGVRRDHTRTDQPRAE